MHSEEAPGEVLPVFPPAWRQFKESRKHCDMTLKRDNKKKYGKCCTHKGVGRGAALLAHTKLT